MTGLANLVENLTSIALVAIGLLAAVGTYRSRALSSMGWLGKFGLSLGVFVVIWRVRDIMSWIF